MSREDANPPRTSWSARLTCEKYSALGYRGTLEACSVQQASLDKTCRFKHFQKNLFWHGAVASASPGGRRLRTPLRKSFIHKDLVRHLKAPAGPQDPEGFRKGLTLAQHQVVYAV